LFDRSLSSVVVTTSTVLTISLLHVSSTRVSYVKVGRSTVA